MAGVVAVYLAAFKWLKVPQSMWRFSGFGEVQRLTLACAVAGIVAAAAVMGLQLYQVPRAVLALHPLIALMAVAMLRVLYRMLYEHSRWRITGGECRSPSVTKVAGDAATTPAPLSATSARNMPMPTVIAVRKDCGMPCMKSSRSPVTVTIRNRQPEMNTAPRATCH
eukprot:gene18288-24905_t